MILKQDKVDYNEIYEVIDAGFKLLSIAKVIVNGDAFGWIFRFDGNETIPQEERDMESWREHE